MILLDDEPFSAGLAAGGDQLQDRQPALADRRIEQLGIAAQVLEMQCRHTSLMATNKLDRIKPGVGDPAQIQLEHQHLGTSRLGQNIQRIATVGLGKLKGVIMVGELKASRLTTLADLPQLLTNTSEVVNTLAVIAR